jgi:branched-chain amino acid transport system ATP-binding protein
MSLLLDVKGLTKRYGGLTANAEMTFDVNEGEIVGIIGPNGAGKSTLFDLITGFQPPDAGRVLLDGRDITGLPAHDTVAAGLALVPEGRAILGRMTVEENLVLAGERRQPPGRLRAAIDDQCARFPILGERRHQTAGSLSGGQQQMLAFARALLARPRVLLLDEPSMGLSPILVQQIFETINTIHRDGTTILLVEQNARLALSVADYAYVLEQGAVVLEGHPRDLAEDERVKDAYLGGG